MERELLKPLRVARTAGQTVALARSLPGQPHQRGALRLGLAIVVASGLVGVAQAFAVRSPLLIGIALYTCWLVAVMHQWRWGLYGALLYIPFSGVATVLLYPNTVIAPVLRDALFVL